MSPRALWQLTRIDGLRTLWRALEEFFVDPRLRQLFARYATYNGSSPYHAPATLAVIAHVENAYGIFAVEGGIVRLAEALRRRAEELGVVIRCNADVEEIVVEPTGGPLATNLRARGVRVNGSVEWADCIIANCDVGDALERLLPTAAPARKLLRRYQDEELSLSAYVLLAVAEPPPLSLLHHNVFFSRDYAHEFEELVVRRRPPDDPTVYVCAEAPGRYFFLTNAPPLDARGAAPQTTIDWAVESGRCRARIERVLARHGWRLQPSATHELPPTDFASRFPSSRGAIYGVASNSRMAAFRRPANTLPGVDALYFCGGTVHPGAGLPMVCLSARIATKLALESGTIKTA
jgi:1-hydroxycarotenoid 3,4-desaturase